MGMSFTMNVFGFEEVLCITSVLDWCDGSVSVLSLAINSSRPHLQ